MQKEIERIVGRYDLARGSGDGFDLESFELAIRSSMHHIGSGVLSILINADGGDYRGSKIEGKNGHQYEFNPDFPLENL